MKTEGTADLCRWLRDNSSGIYRNAAVAAVVIESQHAELIERQSEIDRLTRELAEAKARAVRGQAESLLKVLVEALDSSFISSWQSTAGWQSQLDAAREWLSARPESPPNGLPKESGNVE